MADRVGGIVGAAVLGKLQQLHRRRCRQGAHRSCVVPQGDPALTAQLVRATYNITHWTTMPRGGHFAAFEQPGLFVDDVSAFFDTVR
jgi:pimeloyl-ACP methyl ester carboxylesterase